MAEEAVVEVVAAVLDPEPNPKRLMGLKEPFEFFDEALSLTAGSGLEAEIAGLTIFEEEATGMLVGFGGSAALVPAPFQTFFTRFLAEDKNPNLEAVPLFSRDGSLKSPICGERGLTLCIGEGWTANALSRPNSANAAAPSPCVSSPSNSFDLFLLLPLLFLLSSCLRKLRDGSRAREVDSWFLRHPPVLLRFFFLFVIIPEPTWENLLPSEMVRGPRGRDTRSLRPFRLSVVNTKSCRLSLFRPGNHVLLCR